MDGERSAGLRREIVRLAVPAFFALIAEPLFLLADSAIVGHLGTDQLAGLGVAGSVMASAAGVFVFLAYATTATVARALGAGARQLALSSGVDGGWLAVLLGLPVALAVGLSSSALCQTLGAQGAVLAEAVAYLEVAAWGLPGLLVIMALIGALRGLQDTRTPLLVSVVGFGLNLLLNVWFVYGLGWGIAGSAAGTVLATWVMAGWLILVWWRATREAGTALRPHPGRILRAAASGLPLLVRTLALRAVLLLTTWVAAGLGAVPLAAHQVAFAVWSFLAFALDALAIAAQALTGRALGAGDVSAVRAATATMVRWGVTTGLLLGVAIAATAWVLPALFTADQEVQSALAWALLVVGLGQAVSGYVFVLDGVLIGAGDGRWLAGGMVVVSLAYLPICLAVRAWGEWLAGFGPAAATGGLWLGFTGFMLIRAVMLGIRARGDGWLIVGESR